MMSGVGDVTESVTKRSVTQSSSNSEESTLRDGSPVELIQIPRAIRTSAAEQVQVNVSPVQLHQDGQGGGESSEGEGDVEIEHIGDESNHMVNQDADGYGAGLNHSSSIPLTFDVRKRTLITMWQRSILEDLYKNGMTSASLQLGHLHNAAAEKTGLDVAVVKNWIRNRRRPTAVRSAEKLAEKMALGVIPQTIPTLTSVATTAPSLTALAQGDSSSHHTYTHLYSHSSSPVASGYTQSHSLPPDSKRICIDSSSQPHPPPAPAIPHHQHHSPQAHTHPVVVSINHVSPSVSNAAILLVKARVCGSGESDFVEVEVPTLTYSALLRACCEELDLSSTEVAKIRKLPNVLIRKDKDVQRMKEGQELEVVLKTESSITSMLTVNPFSNAGHNSIPLLNLHSSSIRNDTDNSIIAAALANDVPTSIHELSEGGSGHSAHQVNGLH